MLMRRSSDRGFTLIETLAAITVFAIMTLGLAPLLASSLRGSSLSRSFTRGKNVAQQAMERVRGLPYFVSGPTKVDVLDIYFPDKGAGYSGDAGTRTFTTTCLPTTVSKACPANSVPANHRVTFEAAFVKKATSANPVEQYEVVAPTPPPAPQYSWTTAEKPPESLLRMIVTAHWTANNEQRSFRLVSLISDRRFGGLKIDGIAVVDYAVQIQTGFRTTGGQESALTVIGGSSESRVESKLLTTAEHELSAAALQLDDTTLPDTASRQASGATTVASAPPDTGLQSGGPIPGTQLSHPDFPGLVAAGVSDSSYSGVQAGVVSDIPIARGSVAIPPPVAAGALGLLWVNGQAEVGDGSPLRLRNSGYVASVRPNPLAATNGLSVSTDGTTSPLATQQVSTRADLRLGSFLLLPTTFIQDSSADGAVVEVRGLQASTNCVARPSTGNATATWSALIRYWQDPADEDPTGTRTARPGSYVEVPLGGQAGVDRLEQIQASPPIVYEDPSSEDPLGSPDDIYLFAPNPADHSHASHRDDDSNVATPSDDDDAVPGTPDEPVPHQHRSYLTDWASLNGGTVDAGQPQNTSAAIGGAIRLTTAPTLSTVRNTEVNVTMGSLNCRALDAR